MSTIAIVRKDNVVALAADTLSKDGATMHRPSMIVNTSKILKIGDSLLASVGTGSWQHVLKHYFQNLKGQPNFSSVDAIFETLLQFHAVLKDEYGLNPNDGDNDAFESSRLHLFIANSHGAFIVYPDRAVTEVATFYSFGSGYRYALGAMYAAYPILDSAEAIAKVAVEASAELDEDTGLPVEVHRIELTSTKHSRTRKLRNE